jgi:hypothetical protein
MAERLRCIHCLTQKRGASTRADFRVAAWFSSARVGRCDEIRSVEAGNGVEEELVQYAQRASDVSLVRRIQRLSWKLKIHSMYPSNSLL